MQPQCSKWSPYWWQHILSSSDPFISEAWRSGFGKNFLEGADARLLPSSLDSTIWEQRLKSSWGEQKQAFYGRKVLASQGDFLFSHPEVVLTFLLVLLFLLSCSCWKRPWNPRECVSWWSNRRRILSSRWGGRGHLCSGSVSLVQQSSVLATFKTCAHGWVGNSWSWSSQVL